MGFPFLYIILSYPPPPGAKKPTKNKQKTTTKRKTNKQKQPKKCKINQSINVFENEKVMKSAN